MGNKGLKYDYNNCVLFANGVFLYWAIKLKNDLELLLLYLSLIYPNWEKNYLLAYKNQLCLKKKSPNRYINV